jgi:hypothetical protein
MEFKCSSCDYTSHSMYNVEKHITKKNKCGDNPIVVSVSIDIICEYCDKSYKTQKNLREHLKICKVKKTNIEKELELIKKELQELKQAKTKALNINSNITNTNNSHNNNTINNNNITIQLRPYNDPRLPDDMDDIYEDAWEKQRSIPTYIERVHFSEDYPENHNLCITNLRSRLAAKVFNGSNWETKDQEQLLDEIVDNIGQSLDNWVKISKKRIERYKDSMDLVDSETKNELKLLLYDSYKNGLVDIKSSTKQLENNNT